MKTWLKHLIPNAGSLLLIALVLLVQGVIAGPPNQQGPQPAVAVQPIDPVAVNSPTNTLFTYQGQLLDAASNPITRSDMPIIFNLYTVATGGTACWTESHTGANAVNVQKGLFHVLLGQITTIPSSCLTGDVYLELMVNGETLSPRELLTSVAFAVQAQTVPDGSITTQKIADGAVTQAKLNLSSLQISGASSNTTYLSLGKTYGSPSAFGDWVGLDFLHINEIGQGTGNPAARIAAVLERGDNGYGLGFWTRFRDDTFREIVRITANGDVGIGTTAPKTTLHIPASGLQIGTSTTASDNFHWAVETTFGPRALRLFNGDYGSGSHLLTVLPSGNVGIGTASPSTKLAVIGQGHFSRDGAGECCSGGDYTLSMAEDTQNSGKKAQLQFHNGGISEGYIRLDNGPGGRKFVFGSYQTDMDGEFTGDLLVNGNISTNWVKGLSGVTSSNSPYVDFLTPSSAAEGIRVGRVGVDSGYANADAQLNALGGNSLWVKDKIWAGGDTYVNGNNIYLGGNTNEHVVLRQDGDQTHLFLVPWGGTGHLYDEVTIGSGSDYRTNLGVWGNIAAGGSIAGGYITVGQAGSGEGGEIYLQPGASGNGWNIDNYYGTYRLHHDGTTYFSVAPNGAVSCGALVEVNLQTQEEQAAGQIDRFGEGDVLCWGIDQLELCSTANDRLVQAVADANGKPIVLGAEKVKVLGPVQRGDILVASDVPGYAMVNNDPRSGSVIAQALESFDGKRGVIKAMIRKW